MKATSRFLWSYQIVLFLLSFIFQQHINAQAVKKTIIPQQQKAVFQQKEQNPVVIEKADARAKINSQLKYGLGSETNIATWLKSKEACEPERTVDESGCVILTYQDGGEKKFCGDVLVEVTTPDGRKHRIGGSSIRQYVMKLDPPNNPQQEDLSFKWISAFNNQVLNDISKFFKTDSELNRFLARENAVCKGNIYKQLEYRTIFVQEFLKAR